MDSVPRVVWLLKMVIDDLTLLKKVSDRDRWTVCAGTCGCFRRVIHSREQYVHNGLVATSSGDIGVHTAEKREWRRKVDCADKACVG